MKERPILFSAPMVRAIQERRKWQTRRVIKPQPNEDVYKYDGVTPVFHWRDKIATYRPIWPDVMLRFCPYGKAGDRLWVRETWCECDGDDGRAVAFRADSWQECPSDDGKWRPSIFMPRWASRITLNVASVRVEQLQCITLDDMRAEGARPDNEVSLLWRESLRENFTALWDGINAERGYSWVSNPWVWVVAFAVSS